MKHEIIMALKTLTKSFSVEGSFTAPGRDLKSDGSYFYHGTIVEFVYDIISSGFLETHPPDYGNDWNNTDQFEWPDGSEENRSYWTPQAGSTKYFIPEGEPAVLRTPKTAKFQKERTGDYYTTHNIPVSELEVLYDDEWIKLQDLPD